MAAPTTRTGLSRGFKGRISTNRRTGAYVDALRALDAAGAVGSVDPTALIEQARREFTDANNSSPVGIVGKCYLGPPYEVHTLALDDSIIEHYKTGHPLPAGWSGHGVWPCPRPT
jgi:hypothetical protein